MGRQQHFPATKTTDQDPKFALLIPLQYLSIGGLNKSTDSSECWVGPRQSPLSSIRVGAAINSDDPHKQVWRKFWVRGEKHWQEAGITVEQVKPASMNMDSSPGCPTSGPTPD